MAARWRVAGRIARREVRRHPWRHLLVIGLIFVPTLAVLGVFSTIATWKDTSDRQDAFATMGQSGAGSEHVTVNYGEREIRGGDGSAMLQRERLPEGTVIEDRWSSADWFVTDRERRDGQGPVLVGAEVLEAADQTMAAARFVVGRGRLPRSADEVLVTRPLARDGGWSIGDRITSARSGLELEVVGIGLLGDAIDRPAAAVADLPDSYWTAPVGNLRTAWLSNRTPVSTHATMETGIWLPDGEGPEQLRAAGASVSHPRAEVDGRVGVGVTLGAAGICAVVAVVASAAFALAARRQLRSIGLLATAGADPFTVRASLVLQGALPGLVAGLLAVVVGLVVQWWIEGQGLVERLSSVAGARPVFSWTGALVAVVLGTAAGVVAAWQPARTASRIPLLSALAGRRPVGPVPTRVPLTGLALWGGGALLLVIGTSLDGDHGRLALLQPFFLILGVMAVAFGGVGLAPMLVALLGRGATRVGGSLRMVLRGLSRQRMQSAATVAAVGVALALPVGLLTARAGESRSEGVWATQTYYWSGGESIVIDEGGQLVPPSSILSDPAPTIIPFSGPLRGPEWEAGVARVRAVLGPAAIDLRAVPLVDQDGAWRRVLVIDEEVAADLLAPWAAEAISAGRAVAIDGAAGPLTLEAAGETASFEVVAPPGTAPVEFGPYEPAFVVGLQALGGVGEARPPDWFAVARAEPLTAAERGELRPEEDLDRWGYVPSLARVRDEVGRASSAAELLDPFGEVSFGIWEDGSSWYAPDPWLPGDQVRYVDPWDRALLVLAVVGGALALVVITITLSLRAVDGRDDRRAAVAAGAPPALLRRQRAVEGAILAGLGALLALPLGWIPVAAVRLGQRGRGMEAPLAPLDRLDLPGIEVIPILVVPVVLVAVLWWSVPALAAVVRSALGRTTPDQVLPRW